MLGEEGRYQGAASGEENCGADWLSGLLASKQMGSGDKELPSRREAGRKRGSLQFKTGQKKNTNTKKTKKTLRQHHNLSYAIGCVFSKTINRRLVNRNTSKDAPLVDEVKADITATMGIFPSSFLLIPN